MNESDRDLITDYVLGEMPAADRAAFEVRLRKDATLARAVSAEEEAVALAVLAGTPVAPGLCRAVVMIAPASMATAERMIAPTLCGSVT